jgi:hypothetical protein
VEAGAIGGEDAQDEYMPEGEISASGDDSISEYASSALKS